MKKVILGLFVIFATSLSANAQTVKQLEDDCQAFVDSFAAKSLELGRIQNQLSLLRQEREKLFSLKGKLLKFRTNKELQNLEEQEQVLGNEEKELGFALNAIIEKLTAKSDLRIANLLQGLAQTSFILNQAGMASEAYLTKDPSKYFRYELLKKQKISVEDIKAEIRGGVLAGKEAVESLKPLCGGPGNGLTSI